MEVVGADKKLFMVTTGSVEAKYYDQEFGPIKFSSRRKDEIPRKAYMDSKGSVEIQNEAAKLLKVTTIMPYRPISDPIIEEIDDDRLLSKRKCSSYNCHIQN